jgi:hypothetical protein
LAIAFALAGCGGGAAATGPALAIESVTDLGILPLGPGELGRDGGQSGALGGKLLFAFGDTFLTAPNAIDNSTVLSATAGWSTPAAPLALVQPIAAQLIPYTADEITANKASATNGWALWPGAALDVGTDQLLVIFQRIKRTNGSGFASMGVGTAHVAVDQPVATRDPADLFAPPEPLFQPAVALDGYVYATSCAANGFLNFGCKLARAPLARATERAAYEFFDGTAWQADIALAAVAIDHANAPSISYNPHLGRYLAVTCKVVSSTVLLQTAPAVEGPWGEDVELAATADGSSGIYAPKAASDYNYLCVEHPELASADGTSIVIGYSRPTDPFRGDVRLARVQLH